MENYKYFTTNEVAQMAGISHTHVFYISNKLGIKHEIKSTKTSRAAFYTWLDTQRIIAEANKNKKNAPKVKKEIILTDEEQNAYSLVTDPRWLKLNEWPEIVPSCFEESDRYVD